MKALAVALAAFGQSVAFSPFALRDVSTRELPSRTLRSFAARCTLPLLMSLYIPTKPNADGADVQEVVNLWLLRRTEPLEEELELSRKWCNEYRKSAAGSPGRDVTSMSRLTERGIGVEIGLTDEYFPRTRKFRLPGNILARVKEVEFKEGCGCAVWEGAIAMSILLSQDPNFVRGHRVLELGSGVGMSGIAASLTGAKHVTLSDLPPDQVGLTKALEANLLLNDVVDHTRTIGLDWKDCLADDFKPVEKFPVIIASEVLYAVEAGPMLHAAIQKHLSDDGTAYLMIKRGRYGLEDFLSKLDAMGSLIVEDMTILSLDMKTDGLKEMEFKFATWKPDPPTVS